MITEHGVVPIKGGQYKVLSGDQVRLLHDKTIELLETVGVKNLHAEARELMQSKGCVVDDDSQVVKIPGETLMRYVRLAPGKITLYGIDPRYDVRLDDSDDVYVMSGAGAINVLDLNGNLHPSTMKDLEDLTKLKLNLEYMDIEHFLVIPLDTEFGPNSQCEMLTFAHNLTRNQRNFYSLLGGCKEGRYHQIEMASLIAGSRDAVCRRPCFVAGLCVISPLMHRRGFVEELLECGKYMIPCYIETDGNAGGTTPYTIAGALVENNANILAAVALAQMAHPGAPCIYASSTGILDMRALNFSGNAPESTLIHMASAQLAHYYHLPYYGCCTTDSKLPDAQMGYETMQHFLGCAMAGVNIIHVAIGNLAMMGVANYEQCLMDNEILGAAFRLLKGIEVNTDTIGLDAFREVGHKSDFLSSAHTLKYCRHAERWTPRLTDRSTWGQWRQEGGQDMRQRAKAMVREILAAPAPEFVDAKTQREIWKLARAAQHEIEARRHLDCEI